MMEKNDIINGSAVLFVYGAMMADHCILRFEKLLHCN